MKKLLFFFCCLLLSITVVAQSVKADVIIKRDNTKVEAIIQEVTGTTIKYKRFSNQKGPLFTIEKSEVASVLYANGEVESFENVPPNRDMQLAQPTIPKDLFEERVRWESDSELEKMYTREKSLKNRRTVKGICFGAVALLAAGITLAESQKYTYSSSNNDFTLPLMAMGTAGIAVGAVLQFPKVRKHKYRIRIIEQELIRRTNSSNSFSLRIKPGYNPVLNAPTLTLRAGF